jgi:DNA-binding transcriptional MerR regulator
MSSRSAIRPRLTSISTLAPRLGVTTRSLRYYEELGLISSEKIAAGARGLDAAAVERATLIVGLRAAGVSVEHIRRALDRQLIRRSPEAARAQLQKVLDEKRALIAALQTLIELAPGEPTTVAHALARLELEAAASASPSKARDFV